MQQEGPGLCNQRNTWLQGRSRSRSAVQCGVHYLLAALNCVAEFLSFRFSRGQQVLQERVLRLMLADVACTALPAGS